MYTLKHYGAYWRFFSTDVDREEIFSYLRSLGFSVTLKTENGKPVAMEPEEVIVKLTLKKLFEIYEFFRNEFDVILDDDKTVVIQF